MSRNLCSTKCDYCGRAPALVEEARPITERDAYGYLDEYAGMLVAHAECVCGAQYLAWVDERGRSGGGVHQTRWGTFAARFSQRGEYHDLSFRSSFNDEPGQEDLPIWRVDQFGERCGLIEDPSIMPYWRAYSDACRRAQEKWIARREAARADAAKARGDTP